MKLSIVIAQKNAPDSAFVVWRDFEKTLPKAARFGYQGVELALKSAKDIDIKKIDRLLKENNLEVSCISTGQVFSVLGLYFTHPDKDIRKEAIKLFKELIQLASIYGKLINVGRVRGYYPDNKDRKEVENLFIEVMRIICDSAKKLGVTILIEPVNRYECNFINTVKDGAILIKRIKRENVGLMSDIFHMNIEDDKIGESLVKYSDFIKYVHIADSNRYYPGRGHINFFDIFYALKKCNFDGWLSLEILPEPNPDQAAKIALQNIWPVISIYNSTEKLQEFVKKIKNRSFSINMQGDY